MSYKLQDILSILNRIKEKKILVIGDILLDEYTCGMVNHVSTGIQIPIVEKQNAVYRLGGAANVAANMSGISKNTVLIGRLANDDPGRIVRKICKENAISLYDFTADQTILKQRIYVDQQQILRLDTNRCTKPLAEELLEVFHNEKADAVVIADYLYGVISQAVIDCAAHYCEKRQIPLFLTSRDLNRYKVGTMPTIVVNEREWDAWKVASRCNKAFVTKGKAGICYRSESENIVISGTVRHQTNVSGAGDTVLAIISLLSGENVDVRDIMQVANIAGGLAVSDLYTYRLNRDALINALFMESVRKDCMNKVVELSLAREIVLAWKKDGKQIVFTNGCYDLLHVGHIRSFQYAKQFGDKLIVAVNSDDSIYRLKGEGRPVNVLKDRVNMLAYLSIVDLIITFDEDNAISIIQGLEPDIYIKGEEYRNKHLLEARYVKRVEYVPMMEGISTTALIEKITRQ